MDYSLNPRSEIRDESRVKIAQQQSGLVEDQASGPDGRRSAKPGKDFFGGQRLN